MIQSALDEERSRDPRTGAGLEQIQEGPLKLEFCFYSRIKSAMWHCSSIAYTTNRVPSPIQKLTE